MEPEQNIIEPVAKPKKTNSWLEHVKQYRSDNPDKSYKQCLSLAKDTYKSNKIIVQE